MLLVINCGSSTLKFNLFDMGVTGTSHGEERRLVSGVIDGIGYRGIMELVAGNSEHTCQEVQVPDHGEAIKRVISWLEDHHSLDLDNFKAVGHRVVHGGDQFIEPTLISESVISSIESLSVLAPLHNEPSIKAIKAARELFKSEIPMVAVFDTAFHNTLPERAWRYAIPSELASKHRVRRYGFHGLAHRYMIERYSEVTNTPLERVNLVTLQLGNGCSATAVKDGRSIDTSMGFTPLEGLMMGTRSGDIDPSVVSFWTSSEGVSVQEVENWLNTKSGLLGVSGRSWDMRELLEAESQGDARSALAVDMFCYRVRKYIGSYLAVLGGANAIVFGGGIGENAPSIRARICDGLEWCGVVLDEPRNLAAIGIEGRISTDDALINSYVIPVDEEIIIARDAIDCLMRNQKLDY